MKYAFIRAKGNFSPRTLNFEKCMKPFSVIWKHTVLCDKGVISFIIFSCSFVGQLSPNFHRLVIPLFLPPFLLHIDVHAWLWHLPKVGYPAFNIRMIVIAEKYLSTLVSGRILRWLWSSITGNPTFSSAWEKNNQRIPLKFIISVMMLQTILSTDGVYPAVFYSYVNQTASSSFLHTFQVIFVVRLQSSIT